MSTDINSEVDTSTESDEEADRRSKDAPLLRSVGTLEEAQRQVGLKVEPHDVRLVPYADDLYQWRYPIEKAYLFRKPLHEHGMDACQELIRDVGSSFGAVARDGHGPIPPSVDTSWAQLAAHLMEEVKQLRSARCCAQDHAAFARDELVSHERQIQQLKRTLEHKNVQEHQRSKTLDWYEHSRQVTGLGLQSIRNSLVALLHEADSLAVKRKNVTDRSRIRDVDKGLWEQRMLDHDPNHIA
ncbi:hypothetical protein LTR70_007651 [Exophiala xenobiotica]|uniref:Uncharacterized protein n=1 Tax=Lithohypha guttulata TaxID=1690604 RepID=A0ABR0K1J7_9EURO|nr:hypothetical protein LTR24_007920 [Lithohypha guttulata]KAK5313347.1 hypothetical protein LTR70_007651 [Exophiala xenobiotica]